MTETLENLELYPVRLRMRHRFRGLEYREAVLMRGPSGWGEFSPFAEYPPEVAARWLASALESACGPLPAPCRRFVPVNTTIPAVDAATARHLAKTSGCTTAKVKIAEPGQDERDDLSRVEAVRDALGPDGRVRVDVNGAWDVPTSVDRIGRLAQFDLEYVEQPVATLREMRAVRQEVEVPLAVDESARGLSDPGLIAGEQAADVVVLKVQPTGGVRRTLDFAARVGLPVVISSALETSVGIAAGVAAAAALPDLRHACGLGTATLLQDDVEDPALRPEDGRVEVRPPRPNPDLLVRHRPEPDRARAMIHRLGRAAELLT